MKRGLITKLSGTDIIHHLYEKYKDKFDGSLHNILWQIIVNERFKGEKACFVSNYSHRGLDLGIATKNENGYIFGGCCFKENIKHDEAEEIVDYLNSEVFALSDKEAMEIKLTTMRRIGSI